ncbi:MAG TPA: hypothetical protein VGG34_01360 [Opitutaceae bacterium]|jgi:hypothetical protein
MLPPSESSALALAESPLATVPASVAAIIPLAHHEEFHNQTTEEQRLRVAELLQIFDEIKASPAGVVAACYQAAMLHPGRGFSAGNLKTLFYAFKATGDWRVLVPKYRGPDAVPAEFVQFFRLRVEQNKRENPARAVMMQIKDEWSKGASVPAYGTWREYFAVTWPERDIPERYPFGFFPRGWSQTNLYRKQSSRAEREMARRGVAAAKRYLPHLVRDTGQLRPMELIVVDDFETDILVQARHPDTGRYEICTCTGLLAMDVATRRRLGLGLKPRFKSDEGKRQAITRADVQGLLYAVFSEFGVPRDWGVTILCENASAAISADVEAMLQALLGVQVARTGLLADKVLKNGFIEKGGKPWEKGWIESTFNVAWNQAGAFPGQKGATYQLKPGDLEAKLLYAENLLSTEGLTDEQRGQLQTGFWRFEEALTAYHKVFDFLEERTAHKMQGFEELCDYALPDGSGAIDISRAQKLTREMLLSLTPLPRRESPVERWEKLTRDANWIRPAEHALALLLLTPKRCTLQNHRVTFTLRGEGYTFADADSPVMKLAEGTELLGYLDPAQPNRLYVTLTNGRYVGAVRRRGAVDIRNREAIALEQGEITRLITKTVLAPVRARHADEDTALATLKADNAAKLEAWGAIPAPEKAGVTARLALGQPGAQPRHAAAAASLAAGIAAHAVAEERVQVTARTVAREVAHQEKRLTDADRAAVNDCGGEAEQTLTREEAAALMKAISQKPD